MKKKTRESFGQRLARLRKDAQLLQEELAERAGIGRVYLNRLENDKQDPRLSVVKRLAAALGVATEELV